MHDVLQHVFALVCGQHPAHTWSFGGALLPFCQRCTGLYVGAAFGLVLHVVYRPRPRSGLLWVHGLLLLQMAPQGFHLVPQTPWLRLVSGHLFGTGVVAYLWLMAASPSPEGRDPDVGRNRLYLVSVALSLALVVLLVLSGDAWAGAALSSVGSLGLGGLLALVAIGLARALKSVRPARGRVAP
jgi:uncharacterized membrane protein